LVKRDDISWTYEISNIPLDKRYIITCIKYKGSNNYFPLNVGLKGATFDNLQTSNNQDFITLLSNGQQIDKTMNKDIEFIKLIPQATLK
jgi:hypothetical protein